MSIYLRYSSQRLQLSAVPRSFARLRMDFRRESFSRSTLSISLLHFSIYVNSYRNQYRGIVLAPFITGCLKDDWFASEAPSWAFGD